jgi:hypothetical protein
VPAGCHIERRGWLGSAGWFTALLASLIGTGCGADGAPAGSSGGLGACVGGPVVTAKRVVRLSEHQLWRAYGSLFGTAAAAVITRDEVAPSLAEREFPPISGEIGVSEVFLGKIDRLAQAAMSYVSRNTAALTPCGAVPSDKACVQEYLLSFAEKAFRHPLSAEEQAAITGPLWTEMAAAGASLGEALAYGVYGILSSPGFLYRTELGDDAAADGPLGAHERAAAIAFFLTDRPPDDELLAAAAADALRTPDQLRAQATRLLETPEARANLEAALIKYFSLTKATGVVLNPEATPGLTVTRGLQASIFHEGELFIRNVLWSGPLGALLTSRQTWTSAAIATQIYGTGAPVEVDADGFGRVELPEDRTGLLTLSPFLLAGARSTGGSPIVRGLAVNVSVVCGVNPPFPAADPDVAAAIAGLADKSEREKADVRAATARCAACHRQFDAYGMVLEPYDAVGRLRATDLEGRPIDATWTTATLPESLGAATVTSAAEAAHVIATSGTLDRCLAMNFINYALTEVSRGGANNTDLRRAPQTGSCAVQAVVDAFAATDRSFASLMREIAASDALVVRSGGR